MKYYFTEGACVYVCEELEASSIPGVSKSNLSAIAYLVKKLSSESILKISELMKNHWRENRDASMDIYFFSPTPSAR